MKYNLHKTALTIIATAGIMTTLGSCNLNGDFSRFDDISPTGWAYTDTLRFDTSRSDSLSHGDLTLAVRHNNDYEFANLWLEICYNNKNDKHTDTINLKLADVYGRWRGKGFGAIRQADTTIAKNILPSPGSYVTVRHIMRIDTLHGVEAVGITFHSH